VDSFGNEALTAFQDAAADDVIVSARFDVLDAGGVTLQRIADLTQTSGWISRDDRELAVALLSRLASELSAGIALMVRQSYLYAAGALLRQLVEIEYLMFLGYLDPNNLARWYRADGTELRKTFSPQRMRNASDGLFRDQEYWLHCEVGGHPHPRARMLLNAYQTRLSPVASLFPDAVHHLRRLWTSLRLLLPKLDIGELALKEFAEPLVKAIEHWTKVENPLILSFDGIDSETAEG
jgi:hypothetical protein